ncbi:MAG: phosphatidylserine decarboxylase [Pseudobdellovibrionaceae bacterium]|nr:phosphatidylserine decarboxylase [Bdellovibrionales bacterium]USN48278.1 MAG: phosphatidylserine decarboxylase [Pseudobdellovibrionaceae bacterium]
MKQPILLLLLRCIPKNILSFLVGQLTKIQLPKPLGPWSVRWFAKRYKINLLEAALPIDQYHTINALFTRQLKPGVRPIEGPLVHPADSELTVSGLINNGLMIQAKEKLYQASDFLARPALPQEFEAGSYFTYYLCPTDYHRVHAPVSGRIVGVDYVPGQLWPVNGYSVKRVSDLFARNERVVIWIEGSLGRVAVVMVGATNVGQITVAFDPEIRTNTSHFRKPMSKTYGEDGMPVNAGDELGVFNMGSTVIVMYPKGAVDLAQVKLGPVKMGQRLILAN